MKWYKDFRWRKYYWRVIGMAMLGAGAGLVADEIIQGTLKWELFGHEGIGVILAIAGIYFISKKPRGKDL